jgi:hypothetical protein
MNLKSLRQEFDQLTAKYRPSCPRCHALAATTDAEMEAQLDSLINGRRPICQNLPDPSPSCPSCRRVEGMNEEELDAKLESLVNRLRERKAQ